MATAKPYRFGQPASRGSPQDRPGCLPPSTFQGIAVYMYVRDHGVAHFHSRHGDDEAVIEVATGLVLRGSLPPGRARLARQWAELHQAELFEAG